MSFARITLAAAIAATFSLDARADAITDWNAKSGEVIAEAKLGTPPAIRVMALVQTAAYEAANAAAHRAVLTRMIPSQQALVDAAYTAAIAGIVEGPAKGAGIAAGEKAAAAVLAHRSDDTIAPESYRPHAAPGAYVPTAATAAPQWGGRKPWLMTNAAQVRPAAPPVLGSGAWSRDFNEVKSLGSKSSTVRSAEQTDIARFWEFSAPSIYHGVVRSVANAPGRDVVRNARLFAAVAQAMDDAMIGVFEAKYHYNFWRPSTAIRNGDIDGNDATEREATWAPLIDAPMHPEYPSGHAILAGAVGAVLQAEIGNGATPVLTTSSPTLKGAARKWTSVSDFTREVGDSRIFAGIHYRSAIDAGTVMGQKIGEMAAAKVLKGTEAIASR